MVMPLALFRVCKESISAHTNFSEFEFVFFDLDPNQKGSDFSEPFASSITYPSLVDRKVVEHK